MVGKQSDRGKYRVYKAWIMSEKLQHLGITADTIESYNRRIPRYTSYPTAPFWKTEVGADEWKAYLGEHARSDRPLSLYVHIPFCAKRCLFCGCNVIIAGKEGVSEPYIADLLQEIKLVKANYPAQSKVIQLHLGGGTPNFLSQKSMSSLIQVLESEFDFDDTAERSIEVDPRIADSDYIEFLYQQHGFRRISFGVQDFNPDTQQAIGREQTQEITFQNVIAARETGFKSVNIDLIYGLPQQNEGTWNKTLDAVLELRPDRIALYNFAYLPAQMAFQKSLDPEQMPSAEVKMQMFIEAHNRLTTAGWRFIGMDHYALCEDSLAQAQVAGTLRRNFMGYTTLRGTNLLGFGVSAISDFENGFAQNVKKLTEYRQMIHAGALPIERGLLLSEDDKIRQYVIEEVMCNNILEFKDVGEFRESMLRQIVADERERMKPLIDDGLLTLDDAALRVTEKGRLFLRNIAVLFDAYLKDPDKKPVFSKAV